ncbi:MAG TPA: hypothetical protein VLA62_13750 [Solirubrobacterales bacterium]|nr:hypothetical protein [Solirubrobacterales bacterium]
MRLLKVLVHVAALASVIVVAVLLMGAPALHPLFPLRLPPRDVLLTWDALGRRGLLGEVGVLLALAAGVITASLIVLVRDLRSQERTPRKRASRSRRPPKDPHGGGTALGGYFSSN